MKYLLSLNNIEKEDEKAMIRNRYNRIPYPSEIPYGKGKKHSRRHTVKQHKRKAKKSHVHQAILNKINKSPKTNRKRTKNYNKNKLQQKHRLGTISNKLLGRFRARATLALGSDVVHKHTSCSVRVKDFYPSMHQISKHVNQDSTPR